MGWAVLPTGSGVSFPMTVHDLRKSFTDYNVLHKYHKTELDVDNDFFFVLGRLERELTQLERISLQNDLRDYMYRHGPTDVPIAHDDLSLIKYTDKKLPPPTDPHSPSTQHSLSGGPPNLEGWQQWYQ
jgi:hypothetical protein